VPAKPTWQRPSLLKLCAPGIEPNYLTSLISTKELEQEKFNGQGDRVFGIFWHLIVYAESQDHVHGFPGR
jgi:hypothetical protein